MSGAEGWTVGTLKEHYEALRIADEKFQAERDRRNTEVAAEREKALKIKETADLAALSLAREIQTYKDDKADKARDTALSERGAYVTRGDLESVVEEIRDSLKPLFEFVAGQRGAAQGTQLTTAKLFGFIAAGGTLAGIVFALVNLLAR